MRATSSALSARAEGIVERISCLAFWANEEDHVASLEEARTGGRRELSLDRAEGLVLEVVVGRVGV